MLKERVNFIHELWEESYFFFQAPETYDEKFLKKSYKEDSTQLLQKLIEILKNQQNFSSEEIENSVKTWIESAEIGFGRVMSPFRLALVGAGKGPHVFDIVEIIGKDESIRRISALIEFVDGK